MKRRISGVLALLFKFISAKGLFFSLLIYIFCFWSCVSEEERSGEAKNFSLAKVMFFNQVYMDKLFFAGQAGNWELADFYLHEMEENMEEWLAGNFMKDTLNTSQLGRRLLSPTLSELENTIKEKNKENFLTSYQLVINSCNSCHTLSNFDFINIKVPEEPSFKNQVF